MKAITVRILHRYLGFFLAGIMLVYALSGIVLIYRNTDTFKVSEPVQRTLTVNLTGHELGQELRIKRFKIEREDNQYLYFHMGNYNKITGEVNYIKTELPAILEKLTHFHKATTNSPIYWLNIFFGVALLFFSLSTFWMFKPKSQTFKVGMKYTLVGVIFTLILLSL